MTLLLQLMGLQSYHFMIHGDHAAQAWSLSELCHQVVVQQELHIRQHESCIYDIYCLLSLLQQLLNSPDAPLQDQVLNRPSLSIAVQAF